MNAVIYARSSGRSAESIAAQLSTCRVWCEANGHEVVGSHADDGISGTVPHASRPGLSAALLAVESGAAELLAVRGLDRLARDLVASEIALDACWKAGGEVAEATSGIVSRNSEADPSRKLTRQILGALHEYERAQIAYRLQSGRRRKAAAGGYIGGRYARYGYTVESGVYVERPEQQTVIARIRELRADGQTWQAIADMLNADGVPSPQSGRWFAMSARRIAMREQDPPETSER